jgi:Outer membrane protein beta-barrel domain
MRQVMVAAAVGLLVGSVFQGTALAQDHYPNLKVRFWGGVQCRCVLSDNDTFPDPVFGTAELVAAKSAFGLGGDVEFRLARFFSFDVGLGYSSTSVEFSHTVGAGVQEDKLGMMPLFLGANVHVVNTRRVDAYVGYLAAYMFYLNDVSFDVPGTGTFTLPSSNEFTPKGFSFGVDIAASEQWAVNLAFRMVNADADDTHLLPLDPTFITVGVTRKF